jgi:hypothetical protein
MSIVPLPSTIQPVVPGMSENALVVPLLTVMVDTACSLPATF